MLDAGDPAPDFSLSAADDPGAEYLLSAAANAGPVVLAFVPDDPSVRRPLLEALANVDYFVLGSDSSGMDTIELPEPSTDGSSVEAAISTRASRRSFADESVTLDTVAQLLWALQGVTHERDDIDMRAVPSAGATYPLVADLEIADSGCSGLDAGCYRYDPDRHVLERRLEKGIRDELTAAALDQPVVAGAPAVIALSAEYDRTTGTYPEHGERYVHMEAGHAAQNLHLLCEARGLGSCPVGAFDDDALSNALALEPAFEPLYLLPFGRRPADSA